MMLETVMQINLGELTDVRVRSISGHERGLEARRRFKLDDLDDCGGSVSVLVPDNIEAIATSFFQGMFAKSVRRLGSKEKFLDHYHFVAHPFVVEQILRSVDRSLTRRSGAAFDH
ncbi:hypothetical protein ACFSDD_10865 [Salipiger marinus]|uniref:hypothetical protein n=1 Tax=Salipiger marinus TaxID=555512 RepID=UPI002CDA5AE2|nr:hypothetical protein [Salipiger manganoxidans]MEB3420225.1 hypothetical protein [Salipiger manganoxidans]